tara:strand:- start:27834 stop:27935 length:102 start_codon:yes stop_codon:yes gene_type:complete
LIKNITKGEHMNWKAFLKDRVQEKVIAYKEAKE